MRRSAFAATVAVLTFIVSLAIPALVLNRVAYAAHGGPHATITTWAVGANPTIGGFNPHETIDDVDGVTSHVGSPAMVTSMENTQFGFCGLLFWNPTTNSFKSYAVTGGFQFALDLNRGTPAPAGSPTGTFGGGDVWATVNGNPGFSPYMNFRGSNNFRRWNIGNTGATGIRVNSANGKAYLGNFPAGQLIELDPATNAVRTWTTGSKPYNLFFDGTSVWATGVANAGAGQPDQVLRLNPATSELTRWNVPGGGFQSFVSFGTPDSITRDLEGSVWFTESASNQLGRLNPTTNVISQFTTTGLSNPHAIASSGTGATLQAFFTEASPPTSGGAHISLLTPSAGTPSDATVTPATSTLTPTATTATPTNFTITPVMATITPSTFDSPGAEASGFARFPIPPGTSEPTGMTRVAFPGTVFGSMEGSNHVFKLVSTAIVAPPPGAIPASLVFEPPAATNPVGTQHCVTATVTDANARPTPGITVIFSVGGANAPADASAPTDSSGQASSCYTGTVTGTDTISAFADTNKNGVKDTGEPSDKATKLWTAGPPATLTLTPPSDTNTVDSQHCVTATVADSFHNPTPGITIRFSVSGSVTTSGTGTSPTNANGQATFCYTGPALPGSDVITAYADTNNNGVQDPGEPGGRATKEWVLPQSTLDCKFTDGGRITAANGDKATFGSIAVSASGTPSGAQEYQDHGPAADLNVHSTAVLAVVCSGTRASVFGTATINGSGSFSYRIDLTDTAEPGIDADKYRIRLSTGYDSGEQTLIGGNIQLHK